MRFSERERHSTETVASAYVPRAATERCLAALNRWATEPIAPVAVLLGPPGIGKTKVLSVFAAGSEAQCTPVYLSFSALSPRELCTWVLHALGEPPAEDPEAALAAVATDHQRKGSELLLLIDDAMLMPTATAYALLEFAQSPKGAIRVVLAMAPGNEADRVIEAIGTEVERIPLDETMSPEETAAFVRARLTRASVDSHTFGDLDPATLRELYESSGGVPELLNASIGRRLLEMDAERPDELENESATESEPEHSEPGHGEPEPQGAPPVEPSPAGRISTRFLWGATGFAAGIGLLLMLEPLRSGSTPEADAPPLAFASQNLASASKKSPGVPQIPYPDEDMESIVWELPSVSAGPPARSAPAPVAEAALEKRDAKLLPAPSALALPTPSEPPLIVKTGVIRPGGSLTASFLEQGIEPEVARLIESEVGTRFDFRFSRPGHRYRLVQTADGEVVEFEYTISTNERVRLRLEDGIYLVEETSPVPLAQAAPVKTASVASAPPDPTPLPAPSELPLIVNFGVIRPGESLAASFLERGIDTRVAELVEREIGTRLHSRASEPGYHYRLAQTADGDVVDFQRYSIATNERVRLRLENGVYVVEGGRAEDVAAPPPVLVNVTARPWALIEVDGSTIGDTPLRNVPLEVGPHHFVVRFSDGRVLERAVQVNPGHRHIVFR